MESEHGDWDDLRGHEHITGSTRMRATMPQPEDERDRPLRKFRGQRQGPGQQLLREASHLAETARTWSGQHLWAAFGIGIGLGAVVMALALSRDSRRKFDG